MYDFVIFDENPILSNVKIVHYTRRYISSMGTVGYLYLR